MQAKYCPNLSPSLHPLSLLFPFHSFGTQLPSLLPLLLPLVSSSVESVHHFCIQTKRFYFVRMMHLVLLRTCDQHLVFVLEDVSVPSPCQQLFRATSHVIRDLERKGYVPCNRRRVSERVNFLHLFGGVRLPLTFGSYIRDHVALRPSTCRVSLQRLLPSLALGHVYLQ